MRRLIGILLIIVSTFCLPFIVSGQEYFAFDAEAGKILYLGDKDWSFTKEFELTKKPDLMMSTNDPHKFLAIYGPEIHSQTEQGIFSKINPKQKIDDQAGKLVLINISTNKIEDMIDLGYAPFQWTYTPDHQHFFISYKKTSKDDSRFELLHYDIPSIHAEKIDLPDFTQNVNQIAVKPDSSDVYVLVDNQQHIVKSPSKSHIKGKPELLVFDINPLTISYSLTLDISPAELYMLGTDRIALVCQDWKFYTGTNYSYSVNFTIGDASVKLIDLESKKIVDEYAVKKGLLLTKWYQNQRILLANCWRQPFYPQDNYVFLKVTADSLRASKVKDYNNYEYLPDKDRLYILTPKTIEIFDYQSQQNNSIKTDRNMYKNSPNYIQRLADTGIACIYSYEDGKVRFYDLQNNQLIGKVFSGRATARISSFLGRALGSIKAADPMISMNPDKTNYFIFNRITNDITVYDLQLNRVKYITVPEQIYGIYQIKKPALHTLVFTGKRVFKLDPATLEPTEIHKFRKSSDHLDLYEEESRTLIDSGTELLIIDPATLEVKFNLEYFTDSKQKYTKLKPGSQRYFFIETL